MIRLSALLVGTWVHGPPGANLRLTLTAESTYVIEQSGHAPVSGPAWQEVRSPDATSVKLGAAPTYRLRALDGGRLGLSGGALAFEVVLAPVP